MSMLPQSSQRPESEEHLYSLWYRQPRLALAEAKDRLSLETSNQAIRSGGC